MCCHRRGEPVAQGGRCPVNSGRELSARFTGHPLKAMSRRSGSDSRNWGAGLGFRLARGGPTHCGRTQHPFDAMYTRDYQL